MSFDEFDKLIRDAADNHHPPYSEGGWKQMKKLLDKHLPEKRDGRRFAFFLLLFLLLSGGLYTALKYLPGINKKTAVHQNAGAPEKSLIDENAENNIAPERKVSDEINKPGLASPEKEKNNLIPADNNAGKNIRNENTMKKNDAAKDPSSVSVLSSDDKLQKDRRITRSKKIKTNLVAEANEETAPDPFSSQENNYEPKKEDTAFITSPEKTESEKNIPVEKESRSNQKESEKAKPEETSSAADTILKKEERTEKAKIKKGGFRNFFFTLSAGPDVSAVRIDPGKVQAAYGVGIGYAFTERFSLRTGFYSARKVYTAQGSDYKASQTFLNYYPNLKSVDADCRVFEIPVLIDYVFDPQKSQTWFAAAGLSTLLMKKETYGYHYRYTGSSYYTYKEWTIQNENKHLFTVLSISGGYAARFNKLFSLRAEPYIKVALSGIGHGKINLNSGGVIFSAIIKPFDY